MIKKDEILKRDEDEHIQEISDFIMLRLYKFVYSNHQPSPKELEFFAKVQGLQWVQSEAFNIPNDQITKPMWDIAIRELQNIDRAITPKTKQNCVFSCFKLIDSTFSLFSTEEGVQAACADDMLNLFPWIILKAKIERLIGHIK